MRMRRTPFYGDPEDRALLGPLEEVAPDLAELQTLEVGNDYREAEAAATRNHPNYRELGTEVPLGFMPYQGENRRHRRAAVANWQPPKQDYKAHNSSESRATPMQRDEADGLHVPPPHDEMPTRRELWKQRQRQRRGKLDPELRRLQRRNAETKNGA